MKNAACETSNPFWDSADFRGGAFAVSFRESQKNVVTKFPGTLNGCDR